MTSAGSLSRDLALALADALSYPDAGLPERLRAWSARLGGPRGAEVSALADRLAALGPAATEELYTATFDVAATVSPYVGHHLCGDGPRRNALVAWLAERFAAAGLPPGREVPDHFAELLRYLAVAAPGGDADELVALALAPAARRAAASLGDDHPYRLALLAIVGAVAAGEPVAQEAAP